jgi:hypothetical protein
MSQNLNPRTVSQSLATAIEGTRAEGVIAALAQERSDKLMGALAALTDSERNSHFERLMGMNADNAEQIIEDAIRAGSQAQGSTYTVQKGDSLSKIAKAHGMSTDALIKANPQIKNADLIYPDQKITLPRN